MQDVTRSQIDNQHFLGFGDVSRIEDHAAKRFGWCFYLAVSGWGTVLHTHMPAVMGASLYGFASRLGDQAMLGSI